jgi:Xaa-Pro aminopeptidase
VTVPSASRVRAAPRQAIDPSEFARRRETLQIEARERGWPGVAVFGRGGGTYDRHGDLLYLTGHYQTYPYLRDRPPLWSGRAHSLLTLPADSEPVLLCSAPDIDPDLDLPDVRIARGDFPTQCAALLDELGGGGVVGLDVVSTALAADLPLERFEPGDELLEGLRRRKSPAEQAILRRACEIGSVAVDALIAAALPGANEGDAVAAAAAIICAAGAVPYLVALATGERADSYTGRPLPGWRAERELRAGDPARLDLVLVLEGYYCDFGRSWVIGGADPGDPLQSLVDALRTALDTAAAAAVPGARAGDVARAGQAAVPDGFDTGYPPHWGHGLGLGWEGPWLLPDNDETLEEGYALAVEVALTHAGRTLAAEHDVLITATGPELLTSAGWGS